MPYMQSIYIYIYMCVCVYVKRGMKHHILLCDVICICWVRNWVVFKLSDEFAKNERQSLKVSLLSLKKILTTHMAQYLETYNCAT